jgi:hypothetical protein
MYFAPPHIGPWMGLLIGAAYFVICWFIGGLYLSSVIHMGIAHRALDYKGWFVKTITVVNNTFGVYVNPVTGLTGTGSTTSSPTIQRSHVFRWFRDSPLLIPHAKPIWLRTTLSPGHRLPLNWCTLKLRLTSIVVLLHDPTFAAVICLMSSRCGST